MSWSLPHGLSSSAHTVHHTVHLGCSSTLPSRKGSFREGFQSSLVTGGNVVSRGNDTTDGRNMTTKWTVPLMSSGVVDSRPFLRSRSVHLRSWACLLHSTRLTAAGLRSLRSEDGVGDERSERARRQTKSDATGPVPSHLTRFGPPSVVSHLVRLTERNRSDEVKWRETEVRYDGTEPRVRRNPQNLGPSPLAHPLRFCVVRCSVRSVFRPSLTTHLTPA